MKKENTSGRIDYFLFGIYLIFFVSIIFSLRAISSISIGLILLTGLIGNKNTRRFSSGHNYFLFFLISCSLLFTLQCCSLFYTQNRSEGLKLLQRSSGLIFIPLAVLASRKFLTREISRQLIFCFVIILSVASFYCLIVSSIKYFSGLPATLFFYHALVKPISQHAIQFSILVFIALLFLIENLKKRNFVAVNFFLYPLLIFLSAFLVLLSSKLVISFYILYLLYAFLFKRFDGVGSYVIAFAFVAAVAIMMLTPNPVGNRFRAMFRGHSMLFTQKKFSPATYFNGLQFRLLQWRFTYEILNEQDAWMFGLTPGDAQSFLDKKYRETNMYTGVAGTDKHGFIGYHTHNQFLQVLLENGLPALLLFLSICFSLLKMAKESERKKVKWLVALLLVYCFTDAPLETQYGLVIFLFLPSFFYCEGMEQAGGEFSPSTPAGLLNFRNNSFPVETADKAT